MIKFTDERLKEIIEETNKNGKMNLLPEELKEELKKYPLYSQEDKGLQKDLLIKYFNASGVGTWIVFEGQPEGDDIEFFGLVNLAEWEFGYFTLNQLKELQNQGHLIEIDLYSEFKDLEDFLKQENLEEEFDYLFKNDDEEEEDLKW